VPEETGRQIGVLHVDDDVARFETVDEGAKRRGAVAARPHHLREIRMEGAKTQQVWTVSRMKHGRRSDGHAHQYYDEWFQARVHNAPFASQETSQRRAGGRRHFARKSGVIL
jgi:hypothetical protein